MNCYDCAQAERTVPAVAACHRCGVGVCSEHVTLTSGPVHRTTGMGLSDSPHLARQASCPVCHRAETPE
ncbi:MULTISPECIES: DUF2180 family protein [unclassified Streptomyces]|uniref:DUF2180 family protein n=1 Tax=unclassified Streptomyces TaxID=2593676 RepID=UPI002E176D57|nr:MULTISPECIES: DUF2180 family protein [unclassified Streptomyces]